LSYVSIWKPVNDRIIQISNDSENEIIGLLLGRLENDTVIIEESVTGEFQGEPNRVTLLPSTIAKIADDIINHRTKGSIIGWYHSHTESGVAFSETDVQTQMTLQQFSPFVTAMVVDVKSGGVGYFRVDLATGKPVRIPTANIRVLEELTTTTPEIALEQKTPPDTVTEKQQAPTNLRKWMSAKRIVICIILAAVAALGVLVFFFYHDPGASKGIGILNTHIFQRIAR
jgi:proteasome lid subunit RPN8/RPN11